MLLESEGHGVIQLCVWCWYLLSLSLLFLDYVTYGYVVKVKQRLCKRVTVMVLKSNNYSVREYHLWC
jgi:hypothetical protein